MEHMTDDAMVDYKEMYLKMVRAAEAAIRLLEEAQRECEELYLQAGEESGRETSDDEKTTQEEKA